MARLVKKTQKQTSHVLVDVESCGRVGPLLTEKGLQSV